MKICFYISDKPRERFLGKSFEAGAKNYGHDIVLRRLGSGIEPNCDLSCVVGVKSKNLWDRLDGHKLMFDKGYTRHRSKDGAWEYWRLSLNSHHPTNTTLHKFKYASDRFEKLKLQVKPWRRSGLQVLFAGSSEKYHAFYDLEGPTEYARKIVTRLNELTDRPIYYRPKPSWKNAVPVGGSYFSDPKSPLESVLSNAHCIVTHGSNICFEAMLEGIPSIVLGEAIAQHISSTELEDVESPHLAKRERLLAALGYHQWTMDEMKSGECWQMVEKWVSNEN